MHEHEAYNFPSLFTMNRVLYPAKQSSSEGFLFLINLHNSNQNKKTFSRQKRIIFQSTYFKDNLRICSIYIHNAHSLSRQKLNQTITFAKSQKKALFWLLSILGPDSKQWQDNLQKLRYLKKGLILSSVQPLH